MVNSDYFSDKPQSFGGKYQLYNLFDKKEVDSALENNDIYSRFKQHKRAKKYSPIYVYKKRELFQSDVVFFTNQDLVKANNGYKYLFTTIDVFSKMAWVYPLKENKCVKVLECFQDILKKCGKNPERLNTDRGSELICKKFRKYLKDQNIHHYLSYSIRKCPVVERFNLTLQNLLYRIMAKNNSNQWTKYIDQAMKIYLNRKHRTIKMSPLEAEKDENEPIVRRTYFERYIASGNKKCKPKYKVGDSVRIWKERGTFHRGYNEDFTREHFIITKVLKNLPVPRYKLKDYSEEDVTGSFFEDELVRYNPSEFYDIKVIKKRKTKKGVEYLVNFIGYPESMNQWVKASDLKNK